MKKWVKRLKLTLPKSDVQRDGMKYLLSVREARELSAPHEQQNENCEKALNSTNQQMNNWLEKKTELLFLQAKEMTPKRIKSIRADYNLTQERFAMLLDISYNTYKNWEIGHRNPCTSAVSLLTLAEQNPKLFLKQQECG